MVSLRSGDSPSFERKPSKPRISYRHLPQRLAADFSKRVLSWLYSFSLIILMILTFAFIFVTPVEVGIQTAGASAFGVKLFIIFITSAGFFVLCLGYYFSRLILSRVQINQIPAKSVYLPLEKNDLQKDVSEHIHKNLVRCVGEIKVKAGPLENKLESFNYPGMSPPDYLVRRNMRLKLEGEPNSIPPNCVYGDVINGLGLKVRIDGLLAGNFAVPKDYTFKDMVQAIAENLESEGHLTGELARAASTITAQYEKFKFGPDLIVQHELVEFMTSFEKLVTVFVNFRTRDEDDYSAQVFAGNSSLFRAPTSRNDSSKSNFLDPFDYRGEDSAGEPYGAHNDFFRTMSRTSSRSRRNSSQSGLSRRNSLWSVVKSRLGRGPRSGGPTVET